MQVANRWSDLDYGVVSACSLFNTVKHYSLVAPDPDRLRSNQVPYELAILLLFDCAVSVVKDLGSVESVIHGVEETSVLKESSVESLLVCRVAAKGWDRSANHHGGEVGVNNFLASVSIGVLNVPQEIRSGRNHYLRESLDRGQSGKVGNSTVSVGDSVNAWSTSSGEEFPSREGSGPCLLVVKAIDSASELLRI